MCFCKRFRFCRTVPFYKNSRQGDRSARPLDPFRSGRDSPRTPPGPVEA